MSGANWCGGYRMSEHALWRQRQMQIPDTELAKCLSDPENVYSSDARGETRQRGRIAAIVRRGTVVTVLWKTTEQYQRKDG